MSDLKNIPIQDSYNTKLTQQWNGWTGTIYVQSVPAATIWSGAVMYIVVDPGKSNQQVAVVDSYNAINKTMNVSSITVAKWSGVNYTQKSHSVGAVVRISDSYGFWSDVQTAVNSKLDINGGNGLEYADTTVRDSALWGNWVATKNYRMVKAGSTYYNYNLSLGQRQSVSTGTAPATATDTTLWVVELATAIEYKENAMLDPYRPLVVESRMSVFDHYPTTNLTANDLFSLGLDADGSKGRISYSNLLTNLNNSLAFAKSFGSGSDGDVTISTNTTLTQDMYYNNLTINSWVTLDPAGYKIFVKWTFSGTGKVARNGNNGSNASWQTAGAGWVTLAQGTLHVNGTATAGTDGAVGTWPAWAPTAGGNAINSMSNTNGASWGFGWDGTAGIAWWTATRWSLYNSSVMPSLQYLMTIGSMPQYTGQPWATGWRWWWTSPWSNTWGGGWWAGGAGWSIWIAAAIWSFSGTIEAKGWNGGNGGNGSVYAWRAGGWWGGGWWNGGVVLRFVWTSTATPTVTVTWWTGGAGWLGANSSGSGVPYNAGAWASGSTGVDLLF